MTTERKLIEKLEWLSNGYGTITDKYGVIHYVIIKHDLDAFISELESELSSLEKELAEQKGETGMSAEEIKKYVVGFMFTNNCQNVILIRKKKPLWQEGKLNGVGGKIELNETPLTAMIREYHEEAGVVFDKWDNFLTIQYLSCTVYFFKGFDDGCFYQSETKELENIEKIEIGHWPFNEVIPNLNWIINLALDPDIEHTEAMEEYRQAGIREELTKFRNYFNSYRDDQIDESDIDGFIDEYFKSKQQ